MKHKVILAIDQGTTGTRAILYDQEAKPLAAAYREFKQYFPKPGWVEHDPQEIWSSTLQVIRQALERSSVTAQDIAAIGITNQRETTVLWDKKTGKPIHRAIVWQDRRTSEFCKKLRDKGYENEFRARTGLVLDPYFSGTKIAWLLKHIPGARQKARRGQLLFGTIDSWILWKLTGAKSHATDYTNASRTLLFNIKTRTWDERLLRILNIPSAFLPKAQDSGSFFGETAAGGVLPKGIPILSMMGDQQAALYGQACYSPGQVKNTYGTGCFIVINLGKSFKKPPFGVLATLCCDEDGKSNYALEGSVFIAGAVVQWLRDGLQFFKDAKQSEALARSVKDTDGVTLIPAFAGLGSPYWNPYVRGIISGLTRGTTRAHIVRAALESIAHQTADVVELIQDQTEIPIRTLKVDGGATRNKFLMQFQADLLGIPILVSHISEATAWGVAKLAAKVSGLWPSLKSVDDKFNFDRFVPRLGRAEARGWRAKWKCEVNRLLAKF